MVFVILVQFLLRLVFADCLKKPSLSVIRILNFLERCGILSSNDIFEKVSSFSNSDLIQIYNTCKQFPLRLPLAAAMLKTGIFEDYDFSTKLAISGLEGGAHVGVYLYQSIRNDDIRKLCEKYLTKNSTEKHLVMYTTEHEKWVYLECFFADILKPLVQPGLETKTILVHYVLAAAFGGSDSLKIRQARKHLLEKDDFE